MFANTAVGYSFDIDQRRKEEPVRKQTDLNDYNLR